LLEQSPSASLARFWSRLGSSITYRSPHVGRCCGSARKGEHCPTRRVLPALPGSSAVAPLDHRLPHRPCSAALAPVAMEGADAGAPEGSAARGTASPSNFVEATARRLHPWQILYEPGNEQPLEEKYNNPLTAELCSPNDPAKDTKSRGDVCKTPKDSNSSSLCDTPRGVSQSARTTLAPANRMYVVRTLCDPHFGPAPRRTLPLESR
jgi:hypothetical protein